VEALSPEDRRRLVDEVAPALFPELERAAVERSSEPVVVVEYRAEWPALFESWRGRLLRALGEAAIRIEHVGSTAVPGLAAKPVVDVLVAVRDVGAVDEYRPAIERAGVPFRVRESDHALFRPDDGPARVVHVHVCSAGSQWERDHLLFRDYVLAHPEAAAEYARLKHDLARRFGDDRLAYTDAKTGFVLDALDAAKQWAAVTGWSP
jgi:GrpB-like predicted nucleotidyltransferase (UPF0157 family)